MEMEEFSEEEKLEARKIMAAEWNSFRPPVEIDQRITELVWEHFSEVKIIKKLSEEFEAKSCYIQKCFWFSEANTLTRREEEARGAFYTITKCHETCVPRRFRDV
jgi:hypothetical protein